MEMITDGTFLSVTKLHPGSILDELRQWITEERFGCRLSFS